MSSTLGETLSLPEIEASAAKLFLEDGNEFTGFSFGHVEGVSGEVVFNTGMVGYPESLTDPSYAGQILCLTYPLMGNYGVPSDETDQFGLLRNFEGRKIYVKGLIISNYSFTHSHYSAKRSLGEWLKEQKVFGIFGVDTRALTKHIREKGSMLGKLIEEGQASYAEIPWDNPFSRNLAAEVSVTEKKTYHPPLELEEGEQSPGGHEFQDIGGADIHIVAVDCGMKFNIIRYFVNVLRVKLTVVPWNYDFTGDDFDGLFLSNGPGDPVQCEQTIQHIRKMMLRHKGNKPLIPIFGICLGHQLLALAAGAKTYKMKFGNRGMNQPCIDLRTSRCYVTPQNHGFAVDTNSLPPDWTPLFVNANDGSNEGISHRFKPWFSVQFHPEAAGGPTDTAYLFRNFIAAVAQPSTLPVTTVPYSMPFSVKKVLVLGSGGLSIGQAGEFDYSGSQAIKALKESGIFSVLINPNIATVQTSMGLADRVYFLPVNPKFVTEVIEKERPDGLFCTFGGQTALNCAVALHESGVLDRFHVNILGTPIRAIIMTEDRELFAKAVQEIGYSVAESECCDNVEGSVKAAARLGYPVLVRAAYALGGLGSGFAHNEEELRDLLVKSFVASSQVIIDKSLRGWKELEYEVVRDSKDNCITVCNMENLDPMGIHTGDSIVVAPSQTLTNSEYFRLRKCAQAMIRHIGVVGECNIQFAVDPLSKEFRIIEVNARLSRSSALASKATGYPLAYVAAKLALGHDLIQLRNSVTKCTTACFEPSLDYCVVKVPRWDLKKFSTVHPEVGSCMKSVGEVMAIGRRFEEAIQKALRMVDDASEGFDSSRFDLEFEGQSKEDSDAESFDLMEGELFSFRQRGAVSDELANPSPLRIWGVAKAFEMGFSVDEVHEKSQIDKWFLSKLMQIHKIKVHLHTLDLNGLRNNRKLFLLAKQCGFSDKQIAIYLKRSPSFYLPSAAFPSSGEPPRSNDLVASPTVLGQGARTPQEIHVRALRKDLGIYPFAKQIDTLAAEFPAQTNYLYLTYNGCCSDVLPCIQGKKFDQDKMDNRMRLHRTLTAECLRSLRGISSPAHSMLSHNEEREAELKGSVGKTNSGTRKGGCVIVLGCGCYRIGSSVEFDWCSVSCVRTLRKFGRQAVVINCNPETVSTDYDESDRLYFEELSEEVVLEVYEFEDSEGIVISVGGQAPNNLASKLHLAGAVILGTSVEAIDAAENRSKFSKLCDALAIDQPEWSTFTSYSEALEFCGRVAFPVLVRPSYVLSGAAMRAVYSAEELKKFLKNAAIVSRDKPVVVSKYIENAKEVEIDAVGCAGEVINYAISEHIENAGVHSGDAALLLPAQKLYIETHRQIKKICQRLCRALCISGPFNIQFMSKDNEVKVIECNLRASRTFPFISKTFNVDFIEIATKVMIRVPTKSAHIHPIDIEFVGCKVPQFSFQRLKNSDPRLGVEMQSTGEVACFGRTPYEAYLKALLSTGFEIPHKNILISLGPIETKVEFLPFASMLVTMGYSIFATASTHEFFTDKGLPSSFIFKPKTKREPNVASMISQGKIDMAIVIPSSMDSQASTEGFHMRRIAVDCKVPLLPDIKQASFFVTALMKMREREREGKPFFGIESWQAYQKLADS